MMLPVRLACTSLHFLQVFCRKHWRIAAHSLFDDRCSSAQSFEMARTRLSTRRILSRRQMPHKLPHGLAHHCSAPQSAFGNAPSARACTGRSRTPQSRYSAVCIRHCLRVGRRHNRALRHKSPVRHTLRLRRSHAAYSPHGRRLRRDCSSLWTRKSLSRTSPVRGIRWHNERPAPSWQRQSRCKLPCSAASSGTTCFPLDTLASSSCANRFRPSSQSRIDRNWPGTILRSPR